MLDVTDLKKHFGGVKAVNGCTFSVKPRTITALIGPNGAGKSTVFNLVSGLVRADSGKIAFLEKNITNKRPEEVSNAGIARLFQQSRLFDNLSVEENLLLAVDGEDTKFWKNLAGKNKDSAEKKARVREMLETLNMERFSKKPARDLSFGQKRLVEIGRTLLNPHALLMLDEPIAGVNPKLRKEIATLLTQLKKKGETVLLIEHDMNFTLKIADTVVVMDEGKVIAQGKPAQIKKNKKVLEAYLGE